MNTLEWVTKLISFHTTSHLSNLKMMDYIVHFLEQEGVEFFLNFNEDKSKANLFAIFPDQLGSIQNGIILSGHSDVVPVTGQNWHTNPFQAQIKENPLYGRGAADMKGFLASVLAHVPELKKQDLSMPVYIAISYDEEVSCIGVPNLLEMLHQKGIQPKYCIVGEPTSMQLVVSHKGHYTFSCELHGKAAHSSLTPYGVNAIQYMAKFVDYLGDLAEKLKTFKTDNDFDIAFSTLSIGKISGGIAINIIPEHCQLEFDFRNLPDVSVEPIAQKINDYLNTNLLPEMKQKSESSYYTCQISDGVPAMPETKDNYLIDLVNHLLGKNTRGKVAFATEGGHFVQHGIATVISGPGDIKQAHQPDEYIELSQLEECDIFIDKLINKLS
ncbi:acetylornithine deacetylase [Neisseriaceae bacterium PsAf]|nr:acetylornithine deacetylase [Neisseriaceae bacterium PsAf]MCV2502863.1 acetylornithine deacetylase [Neisseriaceae bacterium]